MERFYQWLFKKVLKHNRYNENNCGAGWYECFTMDRKAYNWVKKAYPTKTYWLTSNIYNIKFYRKLNSYKDIKFGINEIKHKLTKSGRLIVRFKMSIFEGDDLTTTAIFQFIESKSR